MSLLGGDFESGYILGLIEQYLVRLPRAPRFDGSPRDCWLAVIELLQLFDDCFYIWSVLWFSLEHTKYQLPDFLILDFGPELFCGKFLLGEWCLRLSYFAGQQLYEDEPQRPDISARRRGSFVSSMQFWGIIEFFTSTVSLDRGLIGLEDVFEYHREQFQTLHVFVCKDHLGGSEIRIILFLLFIDDEQSLRNIQHNFQCCSWVFQFFRVVLQCKSKTYSLLILHYERVFCALRVEKLVGDQHNGAMLDYFVVPGDYFLLFFAYGKQFEHVLNRILSVRIFNHNQHFPAVVLGQLPFLLVFSDRSHLKNFYLIQITRSLDFPIDVEVLFPNAFEEIVALISIFPAATSTLKGFISSPPSPTPPSQLFRCTSLLIAQILHFYEFQAMRSDFRIHNRHFLRHFFPMDMTFIQGVVLQHFLRVVRQREWYSLTNRSSSISEGRLSMILLWASLASKSEMNSAVASDGPAFYYTSIPLIPYLLLTPISVSSQSSFNLALPNSYYWAFRFMSRKFVLPKLSEGAEIEGYTFIKKIYAGDQEELWELQKQDSKTKIKLSKIQFNLTIDIAHNNLKEQSSTDIFIRAVGIFNYYAVIYDDWEFTFDDLLTQNTQAMNLCEKKVQHELIREFSALLIELNKMKLCTGFLDPRRIVKIREGWRLLPLFLEQDITKKGCERSLTACDEYYRCSQMVRKGSLDTSKAEVWSLGLIFLEIFYESHLRQKSKMLPFKIQGFPSMDLMEKIPQSDLRQIVAKMLQKQPEDRLSFEQLEEFINRSETNKKEPQPKQSVAIIAMSLDAHKTEVLIDWLDFQRALRNAGVGAEQVSMLFVQVLIGSATKEPQFRKAEGILEEAERFCEQYNLVEQPLFLDVLDARVRRCLQEGELEKATKAYYQAVFVLKEDQSLKRGDLARQQGDYLQKYPRFAHHAYEFYKEALSYYEQLKPPHQSDNISRMALVYALMAEMLFRNSPLENWRFIEDYVDKSFKLINKLPRNSSTFIDTVKQVQLVFKDTEIDYIAKQIRELFKS